MIAVNGSWGIESNYKKTPFWTMYKDRFRKIYDQGWEYLCDLNIQFIKLICELLGIDVNFYRESEFYEDFGMSSERIANIVQKLKGDIYISGRGASSYNNPNDFNSRGIKLLYQNFQHPFNHGPDSINIIRSTRRELVEDLDM